MTALEPKFAMGDTIYKAGADTNRLGFLNVEE